MEEPVGVCGVWRAKEHIECRGNASKKAVGHTGFSGEGAKRAGQMEGNLEEEPAAVILGWARKWVKNSRGQGWCACYRFENGVELRGTSRCEEGG